MDQPPLSEGSRTLLVVDEAARSIEAAEDETEERLPRHQRPGLQLNLTPDTLSFRVFFFFKQKAIWL